MADRRAFRAAVDLGKGFLCSAFIRRCEHAWILLGHVADDPPRMLFPQHPWAGCEVVLLMAQAGCGFFPD